MLSIELPNLEKEFYEGVLKEIKHHLSTKILGVKVFLKRELRKIIFEALMSSPEALSLSGGKLQGELGLPDGVSRLEKIARIWAKNTKVDAYLGNVPNLLIIHIGIIKSDYSDVLSSKEAIFEYTSEKFPDGNILDWLEWMLIRGDDSIIGGFVFVRHGLGYSRTGLGIMTDKRGGIWRVPPEFAGFPGGNFATRAILSIGKKFEAEVSKTLKRILNKR